MLSQTDIARRLPVWHELSQLFLDSELQPQDYESIAARLRACAYPVSEIRRILMDEVAPAFGPNLTSVAGEWAGWSESSVRDLVLRSLRERDTPIRRMMPIRRAYRRHAEAEWEKLAPRLTG